MENMQLTNHEKEHRRKKFRVKIIVSFLLPFIGVGLIVLSNVVFFPFETLTVLAISGVLIISGLLINLTLFRCPFCGERIYIRGVVYKYFYICPHCGLRADGRNMDGI